MSYGLKESFRGFQVLFSICVTVLPSCGAGEEMNIETPSGRQLYVSHLSGWKKSLLETTSGAGALFLSPGSLPVLPPHLPFSGSL